MYSQSGRAGLVVIIIIVIIFLAGGAWYTIGMNRIIKAVPESREEGERVILVTPRATPTSEFEVATDSAATEEPSPTEKLEPTVKPTVAPTVKPTESEEPTNTPEPTGEESPTGTLTPSPTAGS